MSALSNIPQHAVLPLGPYRLDDLRRAAARADQRLLHADLAGLPDRDAIWSTLARDLGLPEAAGADPQALQAGLTRLHPIDDASQPGFLVILQNLPDSTRLDEAGRAALLDVFREAADHFFDEGIAFRVFYSITGAGAARPS